MRRVLLVLTGVGGLAVVGHLLFASVPGAPQARSLGWVPKPARWDGGAP